MFKIGEFSKLSRISIRMLRHYDEIGLLVPEETDPWTGYRRYAAAQLMTANRITALRGLGFSLAETAALLACWEDRTAMETRLLAQRAAVDAAAAALELAEIRLRDALLTAPQDGIVLTRAREAGAIVQAGQTVYTLSLVDPVWLRVYVDEPQLGRIKPGMAVRVRVDAVPDKEFAGRVGFISPAAEFTPKSVETMEVRTSLVYRLRVQVDDPDNVMRQGMPVTVTLVEP